MAGTVAVATLAPGRAGVKRINATLTGGAGAVATASAVGTAYGRLVGVIIDPTADNVLPVISLKNEDGVTAFSRDLGASQAALAYDGTTTGDTAGATNDLWTTNDVHGLSEGDRVVFLSLTGNGAGGPTVGVPYYVTKTTGFDTTTFCLSSTAALSVATTCDVNVGATDASAATWYSPDNISAAIEQMRPTAVITGNDGAAISPDATAPNVNRDIILAGRVTLGATELPPDTSVAVVLLVDERAKQGVEFGA